ncbi:MAG: hypothetical protein WBO21_02425 [Acidimicrobiia bacterium]
MRRSIIIAALLAFGLIAASCGGSESDSGVASLETPSQATDNQEQAQSDEAVAEPISDEAAILAFAACLREEGVDVEDPTVDSDGNLRPPRPRDIGQEDREMVRAAMDSCSKHLESVAFGLDAADRSEREDQLFEYAACMRDHGYDMPDPDFSTFGEPGQGGSGAGGGGPFGAIDQDDPTFQTAQEACADIFGGDRVPGGGPGSGVAGG